MTAVAPSRPGTIVVGVDGSEASKDALRWASRQAELTAAALRVVVSWHFPASGFGPVLFTEDLDLAGDALKVAEEAVAEALGPTPVVRVSTEAVEGPPAMRLLEAAEGADLLVLGSRGHGAFTGMLLGSVTHHCVSHCSCPVVVVHPNTGRA